MELANLRDLDTDEYNRVIQATTQILKDDPTKRLSLAIIEAREVVKGERS